MKMGQNSKVFLKAHSFFVKIKILVVEFLCSFWIQMLKDVKFPFYFWIFVNFH